MCLAQGQNAVTLVRLEPAAPLSWVKHSTTEPLHYLSLCLVLSDKKIFSGFSYISLCKHVTPRGVIWQTWYRSTRWCLIPNIKALGNMVSDKIVFLFFPLEAYVKHATPGWAHFLPPTNVVQVHLMMLNTKYQGSRKYGCRQDLFHICPYISLC